MDDARRERLAVWLRAASGQADLAITRMALLSGGAIQQNWALDVTFAGRLEAWVLRTDNAAVLAVSHPRAAEFSLLCAAFAARVTVPEPLFLCEDFGVTGAPFFVMRRVAGLAAGHRVVKSETLGGGRAACVRALGRELARIHTIVPPRPDLAFLGEAPADPCLAFVAAQRTALDRQVMPRPALEWGLRHLERTAPAPLPPVLNHNDFRTGNIMLTDAGVTAVLDWEFAGWGDPHADLGWLCAKCWRFGSPHEAGGIGPRDALYQGYEAESGTKVDPARVTWWEIAAHIRWASIAIDQAQRHLSGVEISLELALTGHIVPELEWEILNMVEARDA
ncbi:MAG TPA: phosphotransferase family protein [Acetobacteraceae bacterium]|nr:phosphotransferase family protein [Acetobacteraceae bacterium]